MTFLQTHPVPLEVLDSYSTLLNIHKPLKSEYIQLVEHVCTTDDEQSLDTYTFTPAQLSKQIDRLDKTWKPEELVPDQVTGCCDTGFCGRINKVWSKWLKSNAIKTEYPLKYRVVLI